MYFFFALVHIVQYKEVLFFSKVGTVAVNMYLQWNTHDVKILLWPIIIFFLMHILFSGKRIYAGKLKMHQLFWQEDLHGKVKNAPIILACISVSKVIILCASTYIIISAIEFYNYMNACSCTLCV